MRKHETKFDSTDARRLVQIFPVGGKSPVHQEAAPFSHVYAALKIKIPASHLGSNFSMLRTRLLGEFESAFSISREDKKVLLEFAGVETLQALTALFGIFEECSSGIRPSKACVGHMRPFHIETESPTIVELLNASVNFEDAKQRSLPTVATTATFDPLNFALMRVLKFAEYQECIKEHDCCINGHKEGGRFVVEVTGKNSQGVDTCLKRLKELYYATVVIRDLEAEAVGQLVATQGTFIAIGTGQCALLCTPLQSLQGNGIAKATVAFETDQKTGEFICGKKLGKLFKLNSPCLRALQATSARQPQFQSDFYELCPNEAAQATRYAFEMHGPLSEAIGCYRSLLSEFPAELTFFIDSRHHKKIIGAGGFAIQKIMKRFNVYVKFYNDTEAGERGNVLIKTPVKNRHQMEGARGEIMRITGAEEPQRQGVVHRRARHPEIEELLKMNRTMKM